MFERNYVVSVAFLIHWSLKGNADLYSVDK